MNTKQAREELRQWLVKHTKCEIQGGFTKGKEEEYGWPCGTCTVNLLAEIGLDNEKEEYNDHNDEVDRVNEVWRAILQIRDSKL